jgi:hypothetical protein
LILRKHEDSNDPDSDDLLADSPIIEKQREERILCHATVPTPKLRIRRHCTQLCLTAIFTGKAKYSRDEQSTSLFPGPYRATSRAKSGRPVGQFSPSQRCSFPERLYLRHYLENCVHVDSTILTIYRRQNVHFSLEERREYLRIRSQLTASRRGTTMSFEIE